LRIYTRCAPFGLFAGNTQLGAITKEKSCTYLNAQKKYKRHVRIDLGLLYNISGYLASVDDVKDKLKLFSNNTLYKIEKVIQFCKKGVYLQDICSLLKSEGFEDEDVRTYVHELLNNHVLCSEIELSTIEIQPLNRLISLLKEKVTVTQSDLIKDLEEIAYFINDYANSEKSSHIACYEELINSNALVKQNATSNLIQLDLQIMSTQNHISEKIANSLLEGIDILNKLSVYQ
jgi:DNA-binding transcriptional MerR regulator